MSMYDAAAAEEAPGGDYLDNGMHVARLVEVNASATTRNGDPQLEGTWQDASGKTHHEWVWYDGSRGRTGLWKLLQLIEACGVGLPQDGEYDEGDKGRISQAFANKLLNRPHQITLERPEGRRYREITSFERAVNADGFGDMPAGPVHVPAAALADEDIPF